MHVQALRIGVAARPRLDVGGTQQCGLGDAGERAAIPPIRHQPVAEDVLADALHYHALGFRGSRQIPNLVLEGLKRAIRQACCQRIDARQCRIQIPKPYEDKARPTRTRHLGGRQTKFRNNPWVVEREKPRPLRSLCREQDIALRSRRAVASPAALFPKPRDTVLDCFGGSGTTMIAAERTGHRAKLGPPDARLHI